MLISLALLMVAAEPEASLTGRVAITPAALGPGDRGALSVELDVPEGWHLWGLDPGEGPMALVLTLGDAPGVAFEGDWYGTEPTRAFDRGFERELAHYPGGATARLERVLAVEPGAAPGARAGAKLALRGQICSETTCLTQRFELPLALTIAERGAKLPAPKLAGAALSRRGATAIASPMKPQGGGLLDFLAVAFLAGLAALATPCVFPAIPLTVSFFSKYSEVSFARGARLAAFYAVAMVACFTFAGVLLSVLLGATGVQQFAAHPVFNLVLALVLVFFSLNLLGMFEIQTPAFLLAFTNRLEARYGPAAGAVARGGLSDYVAVGVAAVTATTVFFTCTVAFVGMVVVAAAGGEWFWPTVGMLAFSSAFVLPFFLLALFPQAARRLRGKSGSWLVVTRVTLGFVELAASWKFFSNADLVWKTNLLSRDTVLALWVSLFALCGLFLLGKLKLGDDHGDGEVGVPRMLLASGIFAFTLVLANGLFNGRPLGWVDGWLPPATAGELAAGSSAPPLTWRSDLGAARAEAKQGDRLVFVNYTGYTCTNCRYMEASVFTQPAIRAQLDGMVRVELYTDGLEAVHEQNRADQIARFGTAALPFYAVERADGTVLATFPSSTNDPEEFLRFLVGAAEKGRAPPPSALVLDTTRLEGGAKEAAVAPGKWTLINFWATWCGPCREELSGFLVEVGKGLESKGGRFAVVSTDEADAAGKAADFMRQLGVPATSALHLAPPLGPHNADPRLELGDDLPLTVLVAPDGRLAWRRAGRLERQELEAILAEHMASASL